MKRQRRNDCPHAAAHLGQCFHDVSGVGGIGVESRVDALWRRVTNNAAHLSGLRVRFGVVVAICVSRRGVYQNDAPRALCDRSLARRGSLLPRRNIAGGDASARYALVAAAHGVVDRVIASASVFCILVSGGLFRAPRAWKAAGAHCDSSRDVGIGGGERLREIAGMVSVSGMLRISVTILGITDGRGGNSGGRWDDGGRKKTSSDQHNSLRRGFQAQKQNAFCCTHAHRA